MSRKTRSQRQRAQRQRTAQPAAQRAVTTPPRRQKGPGDRMAAYRALAAPGTAMRVVFIAGLLLASLSSLFVASVRNPPRFWQVAGVIGAVCIVGFVALGLSRHMRAIYRIRREDPGAWQPTMGFAFASLAVPLGLSGAAQSRRDRVLRALTMLMILFYAVSAVVAGGKR